MNGVGPVLSGWMARFVTGALPARSREKARAAKKSPLRPMSRAMVTRALVREEPVFIGKVDVYDRFVGFWVPGGLESR